MSWRLEEDAENGDRILTTDQDSEEYGRWRFNYGFESILEESLRIVSRKEGGVRVGARPVPHPDIEEPTGFLWLIEPMEG